jgi:hypothetical protein
MGTAQQENPVAQFKATSFEVSLTCEEARMLARAMSAFEYDRDSVMGEQRGSRKSLGNLREELRSALAVTSAFYVVYPPFKKLHSVKAGGQVQTPVLSYYHPLRVVNSIAHGLSVKLLLLNSPMLPRLWRKTRPKNKPVC